MYSPLVSIIIPIYNVASYIERCLLSALNQTYTNIEIILVDDCTPDDSMLLVQHLLNNRSDKDKVEIAKHEINRGLSEARNTGIRIAKGDYCYFLDSDDEILEECIESFVKACENDDMVFGRFSPKIDLSQSAVNYCEGKDILEAFFLEEIYLFACNRLLRRDFILNNQLLFFPNLLHEDFIWSYRAAKCAKRIRMIPEFTYKYNVREGSITTSFSEKNVTDLLTSFNEIEYDVDEQIARWVASRTFLIKWKYKIKQYSINAGITYREYRHLAFTSKKYVSKGLYWKIRVKNFVLKNPYIIQFYILRLNKIINLIR